MAEATVTWLQSLSLGEAHREGLKERGTEGERASESLWSRKACPLSYVIPRGARKQKGGEGKAREEDMEQGGKRKGEPGEEIVM